MNAQEQIRFDAAYQNHLTALKLQGKVPKTIEAYAFAVRRAVFRSRSRRPHHRRTQPLLL